MKGKKSSGAPVGKVGFVSLGCPKNQLDTEIMLHELMTAGYEITGDETEADVVIVNTCAFIESAKKESIDNILDIAWLKKNRSLKGIIVTGCLAERYHDEIFTELPEVDAVLGVNSIHDIADAVGAVLRGEKGYSSVRPYTEMVLGGDRIVTTPEYTAYLKIAEGCDNRCAYCAIPSIRGPMRSRPVEELTAEAKTLEGLGVKELILVAQDTTRYGLDLYGEYALPRLIDEICAATEIPWIRLLYCYPDKITDALCGEFRSNDRLLKYIDMPIQHISDGVLARMNRHGGSAVIRDAVSRLRAACPSIVIRTTVLCGFPGETEEEHAELCAFLKEARFTRLGAFAYSREEGTPAFDFDGQLDEQVKQDRVDRIMALQADITAAWSGERVGQTIPVLCEGYDVVGESWYGRSAADAPDIDGKVYFSSAKKHKEGEFVSVRITEAMDYDLIGEAAK